MNTALRWISLCLTICAVALLCWGEKAGAVFGFMMAALVCAWLSEGDD